jgi:hypothetical protein
MRFVGLEKALVLMGKEYTSVWVCLTCGLMT